MPATVATSVDRKNNQQLPGIRTLTGDEGNEGSGEGQEEGEEVDVSVPTVEKSNHGGTIALIVIILLLCLAAILYWRCVLVRTLVRAMTPHPLRVWSTREDTDGGTLSPLYGEAEAPRQRPLESVASYLCCIVYVYAGNLCAVYCCRHHIP